VPQTAWLVQRAVLALALMVGFYALVLTVVGFTPPGPLLDEATEPRLFALVRDIAEVTRQAMPSEIYLLGQANAFVAQRGGVMGVGSRRVMGIGLPLLQAMPLAEVRSVVAHEFGHYTASDVALSPWIHATRSAIARSVATIDDSIVGRPFVWYSRMFMRLTAMISKRQEFVADLVSARVAGADVAARALQRDCPGLRDVLPNRSHAGAEGRLHAADPRGFSLLSEERSLPAARHTGTRIGQRRTRSGRVGYPPPASGALAGLGAAAMPAIPPTVAPAASLLSDPDAYARTLLVDAFGPTAVDALRPIRWEQVAESIYAVQWRAFVIGHASWLATLNVETLPRGRDGFLAFARPMTIPGGLENSVRVRHVSTLLAAALGTRSPSFT